jgi:protein-disulfide isomerase
MSSKRQGGGRSSTGKSALPPGRSSGRQQRLANREANRSPARGRSTGYSGSSFGSLMLWTAIAVVIGIVVIGGAYVLTNKPAAAASGSPIPPQVVTPTNIAFNGRTLGSPDAKITIDAWEDFRCTGCYAFTMGTEPAVVGDFVATGKARLAYHDLIIIDNLPGHERETESRDAANAGLCGADQGRFWLLHDWLFTNQSPRESGGYFTIDRLVALGRSAGLTMATFEPCVRNGTHNSEVQAEQTAAPTDAQSTPSIYVNGKIVVNSQNSQAIASAADIAAAINAVLNVSSASPS